MYVCVCMYVWIFVYIYLDNKKSLLKKQTKMRRLIMEKLNSNYHCGYNMNSVIPRNRGETSNI